MSDENGKRSGVLRVAYKDMPVDFELSEKSVGQIEQFIDGLLSRGWTAPPRPSGGGFGGARDTRIDAAIDAQGNEICPVHKVPIRTYEGRDGRPPFKGCPSKATGASGEKINDRGYCTLRFK